jgi:N-acetylglutamate synthase-like GNAT family acetyltransferase
MYLRAACAADQPAIEAVIRQARINRSGLDWRRFVVVENHENHGQIIGVGQVKPHSDGSREMASIAVVPQWRRQGIGAVIIRTLLARERGPIYLMGLEKMAPYYARFGFRRLPASETPRSMRRVTRLMNGMLALLSFKMRIVVMGNGKGEKAHCCWYRSISSSLACNTMFRS